MPWKYNSYEWDDRGNASYLRVYVLNDEGIGRTLIFKFAKKLLPKDFIEMVRDKVKDLNRAERIEEKQQQIKKKIQQMIDRGMDPDTLDELLGDA